MSSTQDPQRDPTALALQRGSWWLLYVQLWRFAQGARLRIAAFASLLVGSQAIKLIVPYAAAQAINALQLSKPGSLRAAGLWVGAILVLYVVSWCFQGPGRYMERTVALRVRQRLSETLFERVMHAPLSWHEHHTSGEIQHRMSQATRALYDFAETQFIYLQAFVNVAGPVFALSLIAADLGAVAFIGFVAIGAVIVRFDGPLMRLAHEENAAERRFVGSAIDLIAHVATVVSLRLQKPAQHMLGTRLGAVFLPLRRSIVLTETKWAAVDLLSVVLNWALVTAYVWQTVRAGEQLLIGNVFMIYQYAQQASGVIGAIAMHYQNFSRTRTDFVSALPIWTSPQHMPAEHMSQPWQEIRIEDLNYRYNTRENQTAGVFQIHLTLHHGERIALVGPSGAGKSTLLRVLAGLYPAQSGQCHGDAQMLSEGRCNLAAISTLIPQEADVFEGSVRENLTFGQPYSENALDDALYASAFDNVIQALPDGLETRISERGANLSGGQRQRLALARGILAARGSSVLLLDEPSSALDAVTEALVFRRIDQLFARACLVASIHRMSLLKHFDTIVLMAQGRILDQGSLADLLDRQALFREMYWGTTHASESPDASAA